MVACPHCLYELTNKSIHCCIVAHTELQHDKDSIEIFEKALTSEDISNWFSEGNPLVLHYLAPRSLGRFALSHPLRDTCVRLMLSQWFDRVILVSICANALFLAADNPLVTSYTTVSQLLSCSAAQAPHSRDIMFKLHVICASMNLSVLLFLCWISTLTYVLCYICDLWTGCWLLADVSHCRVHLQQHLLCGVLY